MPEPLPYLDAYFARIGYTGPRDPTLATLTAVHSHHARAIPYEYLDVLLGRPIRLDPAAIAQKLIHNRRGGYCFEQNALLRDVLRALGFRVTALIARVRWLIPADVTTTLSHMALRVDLAEGAFLADVGFGSRSLITPLAFEFDRVQLGSIEPRRLVQRDRLIVQQTLHEDAWADVYQFLPDEVPAVDFEVSNWFTSTHPQSRFKQNLALARAGTDCRYAILNSEFIIRHTDGRAEKHPITSPEHLLALLAEYFGLHFPAGTRFGPPGSPWPS
jgi:N-hydroxyarylamine O-acetyltransferase